jgi:hypothetical protein
MVCGSISVLGRYLIPSIPVLQFITTFVNWKNSLLFCPDQPHHMNIFNGCN